MKANLIAVQRTWWLLLLSSALLGVAGAGLWSEAKVHAALRELRDFDRRFDPVKVSDDLSALAAEQARIPVRAICDYLQHAELPLVEGRAESFIEPLPEVHVRTLQQARLHAVARQVPVLTIDKRALAQGLTFHLLQRRETSALDLLSITLSAVDNPPSDFARLQQASQLRTYLPTLSRQLEEHEHRHERLIKIYQARVRMRASPNTLQRSLEDLRAEREVGRQLAQLRQQAQARFSSLAAQILAQEAQFTGDDTRRKPAMAQALVTFGRRIDGAPPEVGPASPAAASERRTAAAAVRTDIDAALDAAVTDERSLRIAVLVPLVERKTSVPALNGVAFPATEAAGLWPAVAPLEVKAAIVAVSAKLRLWSRSFEWGGLSLDVPLAMQLSPLWLAFLLTRILDRARRVPEGYNPFEGTRLDLPRVGFALSVLNWISIVILPGAAGLCASVALWFTGRWPVIALPASLACVALGLWAHTATASAIDMAEAVTRSERPPPEA